MEELEINENINKEKNDFFDTGVGKIIDNSIDLAIKAIVPNIIDDQVINIKNAILEGGFEEGIKELKNTGENFKESIKGIITGEFKTIEQMRMAIKDGGILDFVSLCIDKGISCLNKYTNLDYSVLSLIEKSKDLIINQVTENIEDKYTKQLEHLEKIEKYSENWKTAFEEKDIEELNKYSKKIKNQRKNITQVEEIIEKVKTIENLTELINNSNNFELTEAELELASKI